MPKNFSIDINGPIGVYPCDSRSIGYALSRLPNGNITARISSLGGDIIDAMKIYDLFEQHGDVTVELYGFVASAATIIATAAKEVKVHESALYLIHQSSTYLASGFSWANQDEIDRIISSLEGDKDMLSKIDVMMASVYAKRCKKPAADLLEMMKESRWLPAAEVVSIGLANEILCGSAEITPSITSERRAMFAASGYPDLPETPEKKFSIASLFSSILEAMKLQNPSIDQQSPKITTLMKVPSICALLKIDSVEAVDGQLSLSPDQFTALEEALVVASTITTQQATTIAERDATITSLHARIQTLESKPAVESNPAAIEADHLLADALPESSPYALMASLREKRNQQKK